jgi:hypothetical protein
VSRQVNFFAGLVDAQVIHAHLLRVFPGLMAAWTTRGSAEDLEPESIESADALSRQSNTVLLIPEWAKERLTYHYLKDSVFRVAMRENPVIEYTPCSVTGDGHRIRVGRFYWAYAGELPQEHRPQVDRLLGWARSHSGRISPEESFRIFPHAAATATTLDFGFDVVKPNPFKRATIRR